MKKVTDLKDGQVICCATEEESVAILQLIKESGLKPATCILFGCRLIATSESAFGFKELIDAKDFLPDEDLGGKINDMLDKKRGKPTNRQSTVNTMGEIVTQEIYGKGGIVRTVSGVITAKTIQGRTTILTTNKAKWKVSTKQVNYVKIKGESNIIIEGETRSAIFHFMCGEKLSLTNILVGKEKFGEFYKILTSDGYMYLIQECNLFIEEEIL